jgi:DNA-binding NtrC family response regulator
MRFPFGGDTVVSESERKRVLIVDDERTITDSLAKIFISAGYESRGVYSAEEARAVIETWSPNLAIVDVRLPRMNGIDLAVLLKAEFPNCRLILFSGDIETGDLLESALKGGYAFDILAKPVHPTELLDWAAAQPHKEVRDNEFIENFAAESRAVEALPLCLIESETER